VEKVSFPKSLVWYIEARAERSSDAIGSSGSAVSVWLTPPGNNAKPRKYLLTCCHCVRESQGADKSPSGILLGEILCWPPGKGFVKFEVGSQWPGGRKGTWTAKVVDLYDRTTLNLKSDDLLPAKDWLLLDVNEQSFQDYPSVAAWSDHAQARVSIIGYPDGARTWSTGDLVQSLQARGFRSERIADTPALTDLTGPEETAPGMSGGGVFDESGAFIAMHRSQRTLARSTGGIAANHIASELQSRGYRIVQYRRLASPTELKGSLTDFGSYLVSFRRKQSNILKALLAAPLLSILVQFGPPSIDIYMTSFVTVVLQLLILATVYMLYAINPRVRSASTPMFGSICLAVVCLVNYASAVNNRVEHVAREVRPGEVYFDRETIGTELNSDFQPFRDMPAADLIRELGPPEIIYTKSSLKHSRRVLWWSWLSMWGTLSFAFGFTVLKLEPIGIEVANE
jgi:hypothetical protein